MRIRLKLIATYRRFLPPETTGSSILLELPAGATAGDALQALQVPQDADTVILVNGRAASAETSLHEGDEVSAFSAMAGG